MSCPARVLVIPSWYPTKDNAIVGSFFQEQAELLSQRFEVRVLYGISGSLGVIKTSRKWRWAARRDSPQVESIRAEMFPRVPPVKAFKYCGCQEQEEERDRAAVRAYTTMFEELVREGWRPDLLHAHSVDEGGIIAAELANRFNIPWVLTEHTAFSVCVSEYRRQRMVRALNNAGMLVAVSHYQMRCLLMNGVRRPISVLGNLIDETVFRFSARGARRGSFQILTVTHEGWVKDCETFFLAIAKVIEAGHYDIDVVVIGNVHYGDASQASSAPLEDMAIRAGVRSHCRFIPFVERRVMSNYYADCDVFVCTSITETFGVAPREAMAVGRPVISTANGGVEDILNANNGILVRVKDHNGIADAILAIKKGEKVFDSKVIREEVVSKHGRARFLGDMTHVYDETLRSTKGLENREDPLL